MWGLNGGMELPFVLAMSVFAFDLVAPMLALINITAFRVADASLDRYDRVKQTEVMDDNGSTLSGGDKQRISIAGAILKDAPIVLLDEATASIDPDNEAYIQQAITEMVNGKTLVVIAHMLSAVMGADQILMIEDGQITARGTHSQLLKVSSAYHELWKKQNF